MPKIDFSKVEDIQDFSPIPKGKYLCCATEVEEMRSHKGDEMWKIRFEVAEGDYKGRYVVTFQVFNQKSLKRLKQLCYAMGIESSHEVTLTPELLIGRQCVVNVIVEEYRDADGKSGTRNAVPFVGFSRANPR